jgi:RNA polymerase sigma-70 factor (ECF subfamily)
MEPCPTPEELEARQGAHAEADLPRWFASEVLPHDEALRCWLRARYPSLNEDEDIVQESYVRLLRHRSRGAVENAKAYLFTTARNLALDLFRRRRHGPLVQAEEGAQERVPCSGVSIPEAVSCAQEYELLLQAIDALPDRCRSIMILQKLHGLSNKEIASRLDISVNTVNAQLVLGLARCRSYLASHGVFRGGKA